MRSIRIVKALALLAVVSAASSAQAADERLSMFGYFRVSQGSQFTGNKGGRVNYGFNHDGLGADAKLRLGNEGDWAEWGWNLLAYKGEDGTIGHAVMMIGTWSDSEGYGNGPDFHGTLQQLYVDLAKIPGIDATFWMGKKYYKRSYSGVNDLFYWSHQGFGAGIEDIGVAEKAKLSYAIMNAQRSAANSGYLHDLRLSLDVTEGGNLQIGGMVVHPVAAAHQHIDPSFGGVVQYNQAVMGGSNQIAFEYGTGAIGNTSGFGVNGGIDVATSNKISKMRIIDNISFNPTKELNLEIVALYQLRKDTTEGVDSEDTWMEFGGRATYAAGAHVQLLLEAAYDSVKHKAGSVSGDAMGLIKITPAIELCAAPGNVPRFRLFANYASWNDAAKGHASSGGGIGPRPNDTSSLSIGLQGEAWF